MQSMSHLRVVIRRFRRFSQIPFMKKSRKGVRVRPRRLRAFLVEHMAMFVQASDVDRLRGLDAQAHRAGAGAEYFDRDVRSQMHGLTVVEF